MSLTPSACLSLLFYRGIERGRGEGRGRERGRERMQDSMSNSSTASSLLDLVRLFCYYCISFGDYILCMSRNPAFSTYDVKVCFVNIKHNCFFWCFFYFNDCTKRVKFTIPYPYFPNSKSSGKPS